MSKAPKEREPVVGNIVSMASSRFQAAEPVADDDAAVAFMPTDVTIEKARRATPAPAPAEKAEPTDQAMSSPDGSSKTTPKPKAASTPPPRKTQSPTPKSKAVTRRVSLFFDDEMMLRVFKYAVDAGKDPNKALHRLIDEALSERGF
ncbi:hypothetical protein NKH89_13375 [Mesorhizobium sp. M0923]|uniref:hypothetical protein n=1 Tax=unclassified Mesorhizobium TaxID=325217 RepID=UPI0003CFF756|nr:hypothetical protein [Mesorhizobium sp. L48C026A00]ESZ10999.1 hypothetical protein X737_30200 [Mesorhizobium sp. L48C026A00]